MKQHHTLSSEKYYVDKLKTEAKAIKRYQAGKTMKTLFATMMMLGLVTVGGYLIYMTPFVPETIDLMRANGILNH